MLFPLTFAPPQQMTIPSSDACFPDQPWRAARLKPHLACCTRSHRRGRVWWAPSRRPGQDWWDWEFTQDSRAHCKYFLQYLHLKRPCWPFPASSKTLVRATWFDSLLINAARSYWKQSAMMTKWTLFSSLHQYPSSILLTTLPNFCAFCIIDIFLLICVQMFVHYCYCSYCSGRYLACFFCCIYSHSSCMIK